MFSQQIKSIRMENVCVSVCMHVCHILTQVKHLQIGMQNTYYIEWNNHLLFHILYYKWIGCTHWILKIQIIILLNHTNIVQTLWTTSKKFGKKKVTNKYLSSCIIHSSPANWILNFCLRKRFSCDFTCVCLRS